MNEQHHAGSKNDQEQKATSHTEPSAEQTLELPRKDLEALLALTPKERAQWAHEEQQPPPSPPLAPTLEEDEGSVDLMTSHEEPTQPPPDWWSSALSKKEADSWDVLDDVDEELGAYIQDSLDNATDPVSLEDITVEPESDTVPCMDHGTQEGSELLSVVLSTVHEVQGSAVLDIVDAEGACLAQVVVCDGAVVYPIWVGQDARLRPQDRDDTRWVREVEWMESQVLNQDPKEGHTVVGAREHSVGPLVSCARHDACVETVEALIQLARMGPSRHATLRVRTLPAQPWGWALRHSTTEISVAMNDVLDTASKEDAAYVFFRAFAHDAEFGGLVSLMSRDPGQLGLVHVTQMVAPDEGFWTHRALHTVCEVAKEQASLHTHLCAGSPGTLQVSAGDDGFWITVITLWRVAVLRFARADMGRVWNGAQRIFEATDTQELDVSKG